MPRLLRCFFLLWFTACLFSLTGCGDTSAQARAQDDASALTITDDTGRTVTLKHAPKRIATTATFAVTYLTELGHAPVLRPRAAGWDVPRGAQDAAVWAVDHSAGPNMEQLAAAKPDLVITTPTFARFARTMEQTLGVTTLVVNIAELDEVSARARWFGKLLGEPDQGEALADRLSRRIAAHQPPADDSRRPAVFAMFGTPQASFAFRDKSYLGSMIDHLGGRLITVDAAPSAMSSQLVPFSLEAIVQADPDVILMVHHGPPGPVMEGLESLPGWSGLKAVKSGRVVRLSQWLFMVNPGPSADEALGRLSAVLYPEGADR